MDNWDLIMNKGETNINNKLEMRDILLSKGGGLYPSKISKTKKS